MTALEPESTTATSTATILIVEDSPIDRWRAKAIVEKQLGWNALYAENGREALAILDENRVDVILTDLQMPELDGLGLVEAVKERGLNIPVVLMTSFGSEQIAMQALHIGAASYVPKSALILDLTATLEKVYASLLAFRRRKQLDQYMTRIELEYELANDTACVPLLVDSLRGGLTSMELLSPTDAVRVGVAIEEALLNGIQHGNLEVSSELRQDGDERPFREEIDRRREMYPWNERRLYVRLSATRNLATLVIRDEGPGFRIDDLPDPTDPANMMRVGGRGLLLMRTFMDEVRYNATGNEVTLVLRRPEDRIARE